MHAIRLSPSAVRRAMRLSVLDAALYALMVGLGEVYFLADGVRLGAQPAELGLLVGLPLAVGAAGPLLALRLLARIGRRKPLVVAAAAAQAAVLFAIAALDAAGATTPRALIALACAYQVCAQTAGTAWSSWYGDLVPRGVRGVYFARRNRAAHVGTFLGIVLGGLALNAIEPTRAGAAAAAGGAGFAAVYGVAAAFRCASVAALALAPEGGFHGVPDRARVVRFLRTGRGTGAWRAVLLVGCLHVAVYVASPFFNPFMLEELSFSYLEFSAASACLLLSKVCMLTLWGRRIDARGARATMATGALLLALAPVPWLWVTGLGGVMLCQTFSGLSWSAFEVGHFTLLLELAYRRVRPTVFAAQSAISGGAQLLGSLCGAALLEAHVPARLVFAASAAGRMTVALVLFSLLPRPRPGAPRARPLLRVAGFRAGAGVVHRAVQESGGGPPPREPEGAASVDPPAEDAGVGPRVGD